MGGSYMKKKLVIFVLAALLIYGFASAGTVGEDTGQAEMRINVGLKALNSKVAVMDVIGEYGGSLVNEIPQINVLTFGISRAVFQSLSFDTRLSKLIAFIEEDYVRGIPPLQDVRVLSEEEVDNFLTLVPNDSMYPQQWGPPCIGAQEAWNVELGDSSVIVAIVDTGIDLNHPDLAANVDTTIDFDTVNNDDNAQDDHGHGTHVAGTVAASINNTIGVAGLQQVTLMAVKSLDFRGIGFDSWLSNGIIYAADNGARVINASWGGPSFSNTINNAVNYAFDRGVLFVAAAGNNGSSSPFYPASYARALGVSALDTCDTLATWSNWGESNVWLSAPGEDILSTYWNDTYAYLSGTSMATPHVVGVVAAYFSYNPGFTLMQVVTHMFNNADDLGLPGYDDRFGHGRVDMYPFD
jgi:subtilisin family serine protease